MQSNFIVRLIVRRAQASVALAPSKIGPVELGARDLRNVSGGAPTGGWLSQSVVTTFAPTGGWA